MTAALEVGWVVSSTPRPHFTLGKDPVPILEEAGWAPGPVWAGGKSRPHRDSISDRPARSQSLYRLSYPAQTNLAIEDLKSHVRYMLRWHELNRRMQSSNNNAVTLSPFSACVQFHVQYKPDTQRTYNGILLTCSRNICCRGKSTSITYSVSLFLPVIRHAMRMRPIILSSVACPALPYFFHTIS